MLTSAPNAFLKRLSGAFTCIYSLKIYVGCCKWNTSFDFFQGRWNFDGPESIPGGSLGQGSFDLNTPAPPYTIEPQPRVGLIGHPPPHAGPQHGPPGSTAFMLGDLPEQPTLPLEGRLQPPRWDTGPSQSQKYFIIVCRYIYSYAQYK